MSILNNVKRCYACGVILQSEDESKEGYVPQEILEQADKGRIVLCDKCYKSSNYATSPQEAHVDDDMIKILEDAQKKNALIVYVIDLVSFEASFIARLNEILKGLNVLVVANKRDLMPIDVNDDELKEYVQHKLRVAKLNATDVVLVSQTKNYNVDQLLEKIIKLREGHDVYIIGTKGVGKSAILSSILSIYKNPSRNMIVTETYPHTNTKVIHIPLDNTSFIYDTPGLGDDNSIVSKVEREVIRSITVTAPIKRRAITIYPKQSMAIGGLARIDLLSKKRVPINLFFAPKVEIKRIAGHEFDKTFNKWLAKEAFCPTSTRYQDLTKFDAFEIDVNETGERDIGIEGLGWISFAGNEQKFRIYVPKGVSIYTTRSKIKYAK